MELLGFQKKRLIMIDLKGYVGETVPHTAFIKIKEDTYPMSNETRIYAAYGSNVYSKLMKKRCPDAVIIGKGFIKNYRLTFRGKERGVANIEFAERRKVPVVIWRITKKCESSLDRVEGFPGLYIKKNFNVDADGEIIKAFAYVMVEQYAELPANPLRYYFDTIWDGYKENNIPTDYLGEAIAENTREVSEYDTKNNIFKGYRITD